MIECGVGDVVRIKGDNPCPADIIATDDHTVTYPDNALDRNVTVPRDQVEAVLYRYACKALIEVEFIGFCANDKEAKEWAQAEATWRTRSIMRALKEVCIKYTEAIFHSVKSVRRIGGGRGRHADVD